MATRKIRWGILGTGKIAQDFASALHHLPDAEIVAVASRNQHTADEFGNRFKVTNRYTSYEALAKDPNVEIVYVSTLHPLHYENTLLCLNHGKSVLCEKPLTMNARQAEEVIKVAREKKLFFMEGMWTRFFPAVVKTRELIANGTLGDIKTVLCDFGFKNNGIPRLEQPELGGGALLDIGIYPISIASMIFGGKTPSKVVATAHLSSTGVDDQQSVTLVYHPDQQASLAFTFLAETPKECTIVGDKGRVRIHGHFWCPTKLTVTLNNQEDQHLEFPLPPISHGYTFNFHNSIGMMYEAGHVHKMLGEGKLESNVISLDESLVIMKTLDEVRNQIGLRYSYE